MAFLLLPVSGFSADEEELSIDEETVEEVPEQAVETAPAAAPAPAPAPAPVAAPVPVVAPPAEVPAVVVPVPAAPAPAAVTAESPADEEGELAEEGATEEVVDETGDGEETGGEGEEIGEEVPEEVAAPAPAPAPVPVVVPVEIPAPVKAVAEPVEPEETAEPGVDNLVIDESEAPSAGEEEGVAEEDEITEVESAPIPAFEWNPRNNKGSFAEFLNAGIPDAPTGYFPSRVVSMAQGNSSMAVKAEDVIISGNWRKGQVLAVYRTDTGKRLSKLIGLVGTVASSGKGNTRAHVVRSDDSIMANDKLLPIEQVQDDFAGQRDSAGRARLFQAGTEGKVISIGAGRDIYSGGEEYLCVSRGKRHGVGLAWLCELIVPGKDGGTTYGRVVRVDPETCFVKVMKLYQTVQTGDRVRLSITPLVKPGAKSTGKR